MYPSMKLDNMYDTIVGIRIDLYVHKINQKDGQTNNVMNPVHTKVTRPKQPIELLTRKPGKLEAFEIYILYLHLLPNPIFFFKISLPDLRIITAFLNSTRI